MQPTRTRRSSQPKRLSLLAMPPRQISICCCSRSLPLSLRSFINDDIRVRRRRGVARHDSDSSARRRARIARAYCRGGTIEERRRTVFSVSGNNPRRTENPRVTTDAASFFLPRPVPRESLADSIIDRGCLLLLSVNKIIQRIGFRFAEFGTRYRGRDRQWLHRRQRRQWSGGCIVRRE